MTLGLMCVQYFPLRSPGAANVSEFLVVSRCVPIVLGLVPVDVVVVTAAADVALDSATTATVSSVSSDSTSSSDGKSLNVKITDL